MDPGAPSPEPDNGDPFRDLPAEYQQVMSPNGRAAQVVEPIHDDNRPNGVGPAAVRTPADEAAYAQALGAAGLGALNARSSADEGGGDAAAFGPTGTVVDEGLVGGSSESRRDNSGAQRGRRMSRIGHEVFSSPVTPHTAARDPALFPHSQATTSTTSVRPDVRNLLLPSPMPSPTSQAVTSADTSSGFNLAQQGAAAMKWVARLGEFVQRRASYVTQGRSGEHEQTTVVQETVWSPSSGADVRAETQPLFSRTQVRRLQDMTTAAPQLYGGGSSARWWFRIFCLVYQGPA